jgi:rhodanese-related sulfurtransferase
MQLFSHRPTSEIGVDELHDLMHTQSVALVDVREEWEYRRGRVPGARSLPLGQLSARVADLPKDRPLAIICEHGNRSQTATAFLLARGFEGTVSVRGGTSAWARTNRPLERDGQ